MRFRERSPTDGAMVDAKLPCTRTKGQLTSWVGGSKIKRRRILCGETGERDGTPVVRCWKRHSGKDAFAV